ncbi:hypothetical protein ABK040_011149 [Willaertia magna]
MSNMSGQPNFSFNKGEEKKAVPSEDENSLNNTLTSYASTDDSFYDFDEGELFSEDEGIPSTNQSLRSNGDNQLSDQATDDDIVYNDLEDDPYQLESLFYKNYNVETKKKKSPLESAKKKITKKIQVLLRKPETIRLKDKIAFTIGVFTMIITCFLLGRYSSLQSSQVQPNVLQLTNNSILQNNESTDSFEWFIELQQVFNAQTFIFESNFFFIFYLILLLVLILTRFISYYKIGFYYFLLDFCYLGNLLLMFYLFFYYSSPHLFLLCFVTSCGPLAWAIVMWRNSLVFHSLDKVTSVFIHSFPPIICFVIRFLQPHYVMKNYNAIHLNENNTYFSVCYNEDCKVSFLDIYIPHICLFLFWQISYYLKVEFLDANIFKMRKNLQTSYKYLAEPESHSHIHTDGNQEEKSKEEKKDDFLNQLPDNIESNVKITKKSTTTNSKKPKRTFIQQFSESIYGKKYKKLGFITLQFLFHMITIFPCKFMFENITVCFIILIFVTACCVWNGATFYFEKFATNYVNDLKKIQKELEK